MTIEDTAIEKLRHLPDPLAQIRSEDLQQWLDRPSA